MYIGFHAKYLFFLRDFNDTWIFFDKLKTHISDLMKICPVRAELFHANGRTSRSKLTAFRNMANASNIVRAHLPFK